MKKNPFCSFPFTCLILIVLMFLLWGCTSPTPTAETPKPPTEVTQTPIVNPEAAATTIPLLLLLTNPLPVTPLQIGLDHSFTFEFNQPVDQGSFESSFTILPNVDGEFSWTNETTVTFKPTILLDLGAHYTITITNDVYAQSGAKLSAPFQQNFIAAGPLVLTSVFPEDLSLDIDIHTPIWVTFNQPIADEAGAAQPVPFTLDPTVPGSGRWANQSTYIFYPSEELVSAAEYTITFNANLESRFLTRYEVTPDSVTFTTQSPAVSAVTPEDLSVLTPEQPIVISFTQAMDQDSVIANLRLEDKDTQEIVPEYRWNEDSTQMTIVGGEHFARGNTVLLVLNPAAQTRTGVALHESTRRQFATMPVFDIDEKPATSIDVEPSGYTSISFHANVPLDPTQDFISMIDIRPRTPGEFTATLDESNQTITYSGFFVPGSFYSYSLSPDLTDTWGQSLGKVVFNRFSTKSAASAIQINQEIAPPSQLFIPLGDIQLPVETTNIRRVDMQSVALSIEGYIDLYCDYSDCLAFKEFNYTRFWYQSVYPYIVNTMVPSELSMAPRLKTLDSGIYVFELDSPDLKSRDPLRYFGIASNVVLTANKFGNDLLVWATDAESLMPITNTSVLIYNASGEVVDGGNTDAYGLLTIRAIDEGTFHIVMSSPGKPDFGLKTITLSDVTKANQSTLKGATFFLDRPVYHPGEIVNFLVYPQGELDADLLIQLVYDIDQQPNAVDELTLVNIPGTGLQGVFRIPESLPRGNFSLSLPDYGITQSLTVIDSTETDIAIIFDFEFQLQENEIQGLFSVLFDETVPIPSQQVDWQIVELENEVEISGTCITEDDGTCAFTVPAGTFNQTATHSPMILSLTAAIAALDVSESFTVPLYPAAFEVEITPETWLGTAGESVGVEVITRNHDLEILPSVSLDARFEKVEFVDQTTFFNGKQGIAQVEISTQIASTAFSTDENGFARLTFTPPVTGLYRFVISSENYQKEVWFYVNGVEFGSWLEENNTLMTITDRNIYTPGDSAQLFLPNPFSSPAQVLLTIQSGSEYREQTITLDGAGKIVDVIIKESDAPKILLSMIFLGFDENGHIDYRESYLELTVQDEEATLTLESELDFTEDQKALFRLSVLDNDENPVQAKYSLLILPSEWVRSQPNQSVVTSQTSQPTWNMSSDISLSNYIRINDGLIPSQPVQTDTTPALPIHSSPTYSGTDTIFLTNLSTNENGESFIEFPFIPTANEYTYVVVAMTTNGTLGEMSNEITASDPLLETETTNAISNVIASAGRIDESIPIPFGGEQQNWKLELYSGELSAIQSFSQHSPSLLNQPVNIATNLLTADAINNINGTDLPLEAFVTQLSSLQNEDGGWSYTAGTTSDSQLTSFIAFCIIESGAQDLFEENTLTLLQDSLRIAIAEETTPQTVNRYVLQALSLSYQDMSQAIQEMENLSTTDQVWLLQALMQQSGTEESQMQVLDTILSQVFYDQYGAFFAGDSSQSLYQADTTVTALVLYTLSQVQPDSELIPQLRNWLIHQAMTTPIYKNPVGYSTTLLALQRSMDAASPTGDYGIQILQNEQTVARLSSSEIETKPFTGSFVINADTPTITIVHEEGTGPLFYRLTETQPDLPPVTNGIVLEQSLFILGEDCRPGFCAPTDSFTLPNQGDLIESRLTITVAEVHEHMIIEIPPSSEYQVYAASTYYHSISPPIDSPLDYGLLLNTFDVFTTAEGNTLLYAPVLEAGTYEVVFYIKPEFAGDLVLKPILSYGLFTEQLFARTPPQLITVDWENNHE